MVKFLVMLKMIIMIPNYDLLVFILEIVPAGCIVQAILSVALLVISFFFGNILLASNYITQPTNLEVTEIVRISGKIRFRT